MKFPLFATFLWALAMSPLPAFCGNLELRKGLSVRWPDSNRYSVNFISPEAGYWLTRHGQEGTDHATVVHGKNAIPTNQPIAEIDWKRFLENESKLGIKSDDAGCASSKGTVTCARTAVTSTRRYIAEKHVWTPGRDVVMLRATSSVSPDKAAADLQSLELKGGGK